MSEKPKVGDRVRLTYVGTVKGVHKDGGVAVADGSNRVFTWSDEAVESMEKLAPPALRPGTIGILSGNYLLVVTDENNSTATNIKTGTQFENPGVGGRSLLSSVECGSFKILHEPTN